MAPIEASVSWFQLVQSFGIIASFAIAAYTAIRNARATKLSNYMKLTEYHRDIWRMTLDKDNELDRVRSLDPSLTKAQLTPKEAQFLTFLFLHVTTAFELQKSNHLVNIQQLRRDIKDMMRAPLMRRFWEENKQYYNDDFAGFVDELLGSQPTLENLQNAHALDQQKSASTR